MLPVNFWSWPVAADPRFALRNSHGAQRWVRQRVGASRTEAHELLLRQRGDTPVEPTGALHPVRVAPTHARKRTQSSLWAAAIILAPLDYEQVNWGSAWTCRHLERGSLFVQPISQGRKKIELTNRCIYK